jgi:hypothetical protein
MNIISSTHGGLMQTVEKIVFEEKVGHRSSLAQSEAAMGTELESSAERAV